MATGAAVGTGNHTSALSPADEFSSLYRYFIFIVGVLEVEGYLQDQGWATQLSLSLPLSPSASLSPPPPLTDVQIKDLSLLLSLFVFVSLLF